MSENNVRALPGSGNLSPIGLLEIAKNWGCDQIVVIGLKFDDDGVETSVGSTEEDLHKTLGYIACGVDEIHRLRSRKSIDSK